MDSNLKVFLLISFMLHTTLFLLTSLNKYNKHYYISIPVQLTTNFNTIKPETNPVPVQKNVKKSSIPAGPIIKNVNNKPAKETVIVKKMLFKKIGQPRKNYLDDNLQKYLQQPVKQETVTGNINQAKSVDGLSVEGVKFPYPYYLLQIKNKIDHYLSFTSESESSVIVHFKIVRDGKIEEIKVKKSSGDKIFDQLCVRAVELSVPFPPLPAGFDGPYLPINFEIMFRE